MVKFQNVYTNEAVQAFLITAEYTSGYSEEDFNEHPAISFPIKSCFHYRSGKANWLIDTNHILFEKAQTVFTVSKSAIFQKDVTLSFQFFQAEAEFAALFHGCQNRALLRKRNLNTEVLLRRFLPLAFAKDEGLKESLLFDLLQALADSGEFQAAKTQKNLYALKQIDQAKDFIHSTFAEPLKIADLAASANLSLFHFLRLFKSITGHTPYDYLLRTRIEHAKTRLAAGFSTTRTAFETGFNSLENFSFGFRKVVGQSPSQFKKSKISKVF